MAWHWVQDVIVAAIHSEQIAAHGGDEGLYDAGLIASALARPRNSALYAKVAVFDLAASYAFGIVRNNPFVDGNKRTAFLTAYVFLKLNGYRLKADEVSVVDMMLSLADGSLSEKEFSIWLKKQSMAE
jgi:death-on-curing protein